MSQTIASALDNRIVTFVDINDEYNCVICMQVADEPVRCSGLCAGIFCGGCMQQSLARNRSCPSCKKNDITAPKDVVLRNQIMKHQVHCINKGNADEVTKTSNNRKRKATSDEKCTWTGKYDDLSTHMKQCDFELVACSNDCCKEKIERRELEHHLQACIHRTISCEHCNAAVKAALMNDHVNQCPKVKATCICSYECTRDLLDQHRDKDCPMMEIQCEVVGCGAKVMRRDYEKHQDDAAKQHVRLLSAAYQRLAATVVAPPSQIKWRITDIAAKLREAAVDWKGWKDYNSPRFDVFFRGSHKLYIQAEIQGKELGLYLFKDVELSDDKSRLDVGGTSITVTKAGLPDDKYTLDPGDFLEPPKWCGLGFAWFLVDMTPYIDNDGINITIDLKLNKDNEPLVL